MKVSSIGWQASHALTQSSGVATLLAPLSRSAYFMAGDTLIWVGSEEWPLHKRAVLVEQYRRADEEQHTFDITAARVWHPQQPSSADRRDVRKNASALRSAMSRSPLLMPAGLSTILFPHPAQACCRFSEDIASLARACESADFDLVCESATRLIGKGQGLTPTGDDFVGGVLFAHRRLIDVMHPMAWEDVVARILGVAHSSTHPISAVLLEDLAAGDSYEPLHALAEQLLSNDLQVQDALQNVSDLARVGSNSGWNIFAGLMVALLGTCVLHCGEAGG